MDPSYFSFLILNFSQEMPFKKIVETSNNRARQKNKSPSKPRDLHEEEMVTDCKDTPTSNGTGRESKPEPEVSM